MDLFKRVQAVFANQSAMRTIGAEIVRVDRGLVELTFPFNPAFCQHDGFLHAGIITTAVDSACGGAAYTLLPPDGRALTIEFKVNLLAPAVGDRFLARGEVIRAGRRITVCRGEVIALQDDREKTVAVIQTTLMTLDQESVT